MFTEPPLLVLLAPPPGFEVPPPPAAICPAPPPGVGGFMSPPMTPPVQASEQRAIKPRAGKLRCRRKKPGTTFMSFGKCGDGSKTVFKSTLLIRTHTIREREKDTRKL